MVMRKGSKSRSKGKMAETREKNTLLLVEGLMIQFLLFCFLSPYGDHKGPGLSEKGRHPPPCSWLGHELSESESGNRKLCCDLLATAEFSDPELWI